MINEGVSHDGGHDDMAHKSRSKLEEFELEDEPVEVERRAKADVVISVRLSRDEADRLHEAAKRSSKTLSQTAREAIVGSLAGRAPASAGAALWTVASNGSGPVSLKVRDNSGIAAHTISGAREVAASR
jgi:hypothetical protein